MTKLRELIEKMKDKASQGKAVILSKIVTLCLLRATSHDSFTPPTRKQLSTLLSSSDGSRATASATVELLTNRLQTTRSSAVALKCFIAVHHVIKHGNFILRDQLPYSGGTNHLNLSKFRDKTNALCWELSSWVRWYAKHVEQLLWASRIIGFFVTSPRGTQLQVDNRISGLTNGELLQEMEVLLAVYEWIQETPETVSTEGNRLVIEIMSLVKEDGVAVLSEVLVRVNEFKERLECLCFGQVVELVYMLKRLDKCKEMMMMVLEKHRFFYSVRELNEEVEKKMQLYSEEQGKMMTTTIHRATKSDRFPLTLLNSVDLVRFPSSKFL